MGKNRTTSYQPSEGRTGRPRKLMIDGKLQCSGCLEWKSVDDFYPAENTFHKRETRCKSCTKIRQRNYYNDDIERYLAASAKAHLKSSMRTAGTERRKKLHSQSQVTTKVLIDLWRSQNGMCAITGVQMTALRGMGHAVQTNVSIDRIDSNGGYTLDNIRLVCKAVNVMKYVLSDAELLEWASRILNGPLNKPR